MMSAEAIRDLSKQAAKDAEEWGLEPFEVDEFTNRDNLSGIPFLGDYVPEGWERTAVQYFVDSSGFGRPDEPALTFEQFGKAIENGFGYGITEAGQFQVYIQQYRRV